MAKARSRPGAATETARPAAPRSRWAPRHAVGVLNERLTHFESVLGVGFGALENADGRNTGDAGLIVFVDETLTEEVERLRKIAASPVGGYQIMVRAPRTTAQAYHDHLTKNGVPHPERFDCLPDPFWLDASKIHRMVRRHTARPADAPPRDAPPRDAPREDAPPADAPPADAATAVFGEIFVIEDDGTLVAYPGTDDQVVDYQAIFVKFRQQFGDQYDFAFFHHDWKSGLTADKSISPTVFNDISGINHYRGDAYDGRAGWNTTRLQSYQYVHSFQMRRMLHETAHRWLAYVNHREGGATSTNLHEDYISIDPGVGIHHWGNWYDNDNSCMDYDQFDWLDVTGGYQRINLTAGPAQFDEFGYTPVDLYLMGLMDSSEVPGFRYLENPQDPEADGTYSATQHDLTITNIIDEHGARTPAAADSQRVFHQAYILLTRNISNVGDLTTGLVQKVDQWRRDFEQRFRERVQGRAVIDTRLLHGNFSSLYIRDNAADDGTTTTTGTTWNSPDIWVRQTDDDGADHQETDRSQDNFLRARVWNSSAADYDDVTVRFYIGNHAENLPGTDFEYPEDWRLDRFLGEDTITVPAGGNSIAKVTWNQADIPPAAGWHPCLLVEVLPMEVTPSTLHRRTQNKKLAQKNITIVGPPADAGDGAEFRFTIGRPRKPRREHILVIDRVSAVPGLRIALAPEAQGLKLIPDLSLTDRPSGNDIDPPGRLRPVSLPDSAATCGSRIFIPEGSCIGYSPCGDGWTSLRFITNTILELRSGRNLSADPAPMARGDVLFHALPDWYRTAVRIPAGGQGHDGGFQIVRANIAVDTAINAVPSGRVLLRFMEYEDNGELVGGVDYRMNL